MTKLNEGETCHKFLKVENHFLEIGLQTSQPIFLKPVFRNYY
jgi:hypothetical protein